MIYLFTGVPGSGKTLNAIKFILNDSRLKISVDDFENAGFDVDDYGTDGKHINRPIYYHNINLNKKKLPNWIEVDKEKITDWKNEFPKGSLIVLDECQDIFPQRSNTKPVPEFIAEMNTHRHGAYDFVLITQHPNLIDVAVRRLVGLHKHLDRRYGNNYSIVYEAQEAMKVDDRKWMKDVDKERVVFDKKYYDYYKSAEIHTHKRKLPFKLIAVGSLLPISLVLVVYLFNSILDRQSADNVNDPTVITEPNIDDSNRFIKSKFGINNNLDKESVLESYQPLLEDIPQTAPRYAHLNKPVAMPRIAACIVALKDDRCQCYSQRATKIDVKKKLCIKIANDGYFDDTINDVKNYNRKPKFETKERVRQQRASALL